MRKKLAAALLAVILLAGCKPEEGKTRYRMVLASEKIIVVEYKECRPVETRIYCWNDEHEIGQNPDAVYDAVEFEVVE